MPARRAVRSADITSVRHHHGSERNPSPMPSTRARTVVLRARSVIPLNPANNRNPLRGSTSTGSLRHRPARGGEEAGAEPEMLEHPVGTHQPKVRLVCGQRGELAASFLRRGFVEAVQDDGVAPVSPRRQPLHRRRVVVESVAALQPWCDEKRRRYRSLFELCTERRDVGQRLLSDAGDRDDQLSNHTRIVATPGVATVSNTLTAVVYCAIAAGSPRWPRRPLGRPVRCVGGTA